MIDMKMCLNAQKEPANWELIIGCKHISNTGLPNVFDGVLMKIKHVIKVTLACQFLKVKYS